MSEIPVQVNLKTSATEPTAIEHGMPHAMYELARTYLMMRNYKEAIQWALVLGETSQLATQAEQVLLQIIDAAVDPQIQSQAKQALEELQARNAYLAAELTRSSKEKASFIVQTEEA